MTQDSAEPIEPWTAKRRAGLMRSILKAETSVAEAARRHGLRVAEVEDWQERFLLEAENALCSPPGRRRSQGGVDQDAQAKERSDESTT